MAWLIGYPAAYPALFKSPIQTTKIRPERSSMRPKIARRKSDIHEKKSQTTIISNRPNFSDFFIQKPCRTYAGIAIIPMRIKPLCIIRFTHATFLRDPSRKLTKNVVATLSQQPKRSIHPVVHRRIGTKECLLRTSV